MIMQYFLLEQLEHGNYGVYGLKVLAVDTLDNLLKKTPQEFGIYSTAWGFWPIISINERSKHAIYRWADEEDNYDKTGWHITDFGKKHLGKYRDFISVSAPPTP